MVGNGPQVRQNNSTEYSARVCTTRICHNSSTPAVVRCVVGVGGAVWVHEHRVIRSSHTAPKLPSPEGYILGITPSQYCIQPTKQSRAVLALQILPTCLLKNYVILVLKQSTGTSLSQCRPKTISVSSRNNVIYECLLFVQTQVKSSCQINTNCHNFQAAKTTNSSHIDPYYHASSNPFRHKSDFGKGRWSHS